MQKIIILFISIYIFAACGTESKKTNDNTSLSYKKFTENKKRWTASQTKNYSFVVEKSSFSPYEEKIQTTVENGTIIETKYIPSNLTINDSSKQKKIDGYFDIIQEALDENGYQIIVQFDKTYGYPKDIYIDYDEQIVDEEVSYTLTHFAPRIDGRIVCTQEYIPVCATVNVECATSPCETVEETFSNKCMLNSNPNAIYLRDGAC